MNEPPDGWRLASPGTLVPRGQPVVVSISSPPPGSKKVVNLYVNDQGKLVIEYDETPVP